jgi:hypothetical protein
MLHITARRESDGRVTSGRLTTQGKVEIAYGRWEARLKVPGVLGTWPAFWTLGNDIGEISWPACGEIDIMENFQRAPPDRSGESIYSTAHSAKHSWGTNTALPGGFSTALNLAHFHTVRMDWSPDKLEFFVNGNRTWHLDRSPGSTNYDWPYAKPHFALLNLALGGNGVGYATPPDDAYPLTYSIDYVSIEALAPPPPAPPRQPPAPPISPWPLHCGTASCTSAVWNAAAADAECMTCSCGARITWLQWSPDGPQLDETAACARVATVEFPSACSGCNPSPPLPPPPSPTPPSPSPPRHSPPLESPPLEWEGYFGKNPSDLGYPTFPCLPADEGGGATGISTSSGKSLKQCQEDCDAAAAAGGACNALAVSPGAGLHALAYCWFKQQPDVRRFEDGSYDNWRCMSPNSYFWRSSGHSRRPPSPAPSAMLPPPSMSPSIAVPLNDWARYAVDGAVWFPANEGTSAVPSPDCSGGCDSVKTCQTACQASFQDGGSCNAFAIVGGRNCYFKQAPQDMRTYASWSLQANKEYHWYNPPPPPPAAPPVPSFPPVQLLDNAPACVLGPGISYSIIDGTVFTACSDGMTIEGDLTIGNNVTVVTDFIHVMPTGSVTMGTEDAPVTGTVINLTSVDCDHLVHDRRLTWFSDPVASDCLRAGSISVSGAWRSHGVPRTAWSLLTADCSSCGTIRVEECKGWAPSDVIVVAATAGRYSAAQTHSETRTIASITGAPRDCSIVLNESLANFHHGSQEGHYTDYNGKSRGFQAEVMNLERSILFTGMVHRRSNAILQSLDAETHTKLERATDAMDAWRNCEARGCKEYRPKNEVYPEDHPRAGELVCDEALGEGTEENQYCVHTDWLYWKPDPLLWGFQGIVTMASKGGFMDMRWHKMENCGRLLLGAYCHHFHLLGTVSGHIEGTVTTNSIGKAITVHGTSGTMVRDNVVWNHRGANVYYENGGEFNNTFMGNVLGCEWMMRGGWHTSKCSLAQGVPSQVDSDFNEQAGLYVLNPNAVEVYGNHIFGFDNAHFINQQPNAFVGTAWGQDAQDGYTPTKAMPIALYANNVFHTNAGFGWYVNSIESYSNTYTPAHNRTLLALSHSAPSCAVHMALDVRIDVLGRAIDWRDAVPFHPDTGEDQSLPSFIVNHTEYWNDFSAGSYDASDITFQNYTCLGGLKCLYWKTYRRGVYTGPLVDGGTWVGGPQGHQLPGGSSLVELKEVAFEGANGNIAVNHHCALGQVTGGLCASHYWINNPLGTHGDGIAFRDETGGKTDCIIEYDGGVSQTLIRNTANAAFDTATCTHDGDWVKCDQSWKVRNVRLYTKPRGVLSVVTNDGTYAIDVHPVNVKAQSSGGYAPYSPVGDLRVQGYTFLVKAGHSVTINLPTSTHDDLFVLEYSEDAWPASKQSSISLTVAGPGAGVLAGGPYTILSTHPRNWITPYGAFVPQAGAWWDAMDGDGHGWATDYNPTLYEADRLQQLINSGITWKRNDPPVLRPSPS